MQAVAAPQPKGNLLAPSLLCEGVGLDDHAFPSKVFTRLVCKVREGPELPYSNTSSVCSLGSVQTTKDGSASTSHSISSSSSSKISTSSDSDTDTILGEQAYLPGLKCCDPGLLFCLGT